MKPEPIEVYKGYQLVWGYDYQRPPTSRYLPTVLHPTEPGRSMVAKTIKGARAIVDALVSKTVGW